MIRLSLFLGLMLGMTACGEKKEQPKKTKAAREASDSYTNSACGGFAADGVAFLSNAELDADTSYLESQFNTGKQESLCGLMQSTSKPTLLLQFVGVVCETCRDEAASLTKLVTESPKGSKMVHVLVFVDAASTGVEEAWFANFNQTNTQGKALVRYEPGKKMFRKFNSDPSGLTFGTTVAVHGAGHVFVVDGIEDLPELMRQAEAMNP